MTTYHALNWPKFRFAHYPNVPLLCRPTPGGTGGQVGVTILGLLHNSLQIDDKPRKAGVCKGTPAPALYGGNECRLRLRGGLLTKRTLSTAWRLLCNSLQLDDKPRKAGVCKGTPAPALYGGNECRLRLRGGLLTKRTLSTASRLLCNSLISCLTAGKIIPMPSCRKPAPSINWKTTPASTKNIFLRLPVYGNAICHISQHGCNNTAVRQFRF